MHTADRRVALVTGATGAIGEAIARQLAQIHGYEVVLACRSRRKAEAALSRIVHGTKNAAVRIAELDLERPANIRALAENWNSPLHVLANNASATPARRHETADGLEVQFATNILGYFAMISAFSNALEKSAPARVINVASYWAGDLELDDLEFQKRRYDNNTAYRQSKQAERMLTVMFAEQLANRGVTVNACHPGDVNSALSNSLGFGGHETPDQGADTPVWLATSPEVAGVTGKYFEHRRQVQCRFAERRGEIRTLYEYCELRYRQHSS